MSRPFQCLIFCCSLLVFATTTLAQPFPTRFVTILINSEPGGAQDRIANALKEDLSAVLGQQVVLDYKVGAGGTAALGAFKRVKPDGYTILLTGSGPMTIAPMLYPVPYDPLKDFEYVHRILDLPGVVVTRGSLPAATLQEFIALARKAPGKYTFASSGIGSPSHLLGERLKLIASIDVLHVPFKGPAAAVTSLLSGDVDLFMASAPLVVPHAASGKLRLLAVAGNNRMKVAPDVPTLAEVGLAELTLPSWFGFFAPKGTPKPILDTLDRAIRTATATPKAKEGLDRLGAEVISMPGEEFAAYHEKTVELWRGIIKQAGIKAE